MSHAGSDRWDQASPGAQEGCPNNPPGPTAADENKRDPSEWCVPTPPPEQNLRPTAHATPQPAPRWSPNFRTASSQRAPARAASHEIESSERDLLSLGKWSADQAI